MYTYTSKYIIKFWQFAVHKLVYLIPCLKTAIQKIKEKWKVQRIRSQRV